MKILIIAPYIYEESLDKFQKNNTGFGMMVCDLAKRLSHNNEVFIITNIITDKIIFNDIVILSHTLLNWFFNVKVTSLFNIFKLTNNRKMKFNEKLKNIFMYLSEGYIGNRILRTKPDIVNIHGVGILTEVTMKVCEKINQKYLVSLHGLVEEDDQASILVKESEKKILHMATQKKIPISVISTGIKERIEEINKDKRTLSEIKVILNGTETNIFQYINKNEIIDIRSKYNIDINEKIVVCIGNMTKGKNHIQVVEAYNLIKKSMKYNVKVFFLGRIDSVVQNRISELELDDDLICCGFVNKKDVSSYLMSADLNILPSIHEGFGLSIIEGFVFGVPTLTFSDLDIIKDIYNEKAMLLVNKRDDEYLGKGIIKALSKKWDKEWIKEYSKQFSLEKMTREYQEHFKDMVKGGKNYV